MKGYGKHIAVAIGSMGLLVACQHTSGLNASQRYVSEGYAQQSQGQDWVMVTLNPSNQQEAIIVSVQSRSDIKNRLASLKAQLSKWRQGITKSK